MGKLMKNFSLLLFLSVFSLCYSHQEEATPPLKQNNSSLEECKIIRDVSLCIDSYGVKWICPYCGALNADISSSVCEVCGQTSI